MNDRVFLDYFVIDFDVCVCVSVLLCVCLLRIRNVDLIMYFIL